MKKSTSIILALSLALSSACGGGSNNDQGTSFSLVGFNSFDEENVCQLDVFTSVLVLGLSDTGVSESLGDFGLASCLTIQNNMTTQFVRADRVYLDYFVPGASDQPPSTSIALGLILAPFASQVGAQGGGQGGGQGFVTGPGGSTIVGPPPFTSLPSSFTIGAAGGTEGGAAQIVSARFIAVPVEVREWLALNRLSLPEPPFQMTLVARVAGVTSGGDALVTNEATIPIIVRIDNPIAPTIGQGGDSEVTATFQDGTSNFSVDESSTAGGDEGTTDFDFN
jgi:hypothetical protein